MLMQCVQVWFGPGLRLVIEEVKLFCLREVNPRVLAQVGGKGCRATFLGTAHQKAQPFCHDQARSVRTVKLLLVPLKLNSLLGCSFRCLSPVVTAPARPCWLP